MPVFSKKRKGSYCPMLPQQPHTAHSPSSPHKHLLRRKMSEPVNIYEMDESQVKLSTKPRTHSTIETPSIEVDTVGMSRASGDMGSTMSLISNKSGSSAVGRLFKRKERNSVEIKYEKQKMRRNSSVEANILIKTADISLEAEILGKSINSDRCTSSACTSYRCINISLLSRC